MGGRVILYTANVATGNYEQASLVMLPLEGGAPKTVHRGGYYGRYLPTGHLVYVSQGNLFAEPFDQERLEVTGPAALVVPEVESGPVSGGAQFAFSNDGSLAYIPHAADTASPSVYWIESGGKTSPLRAVPANYGAPRFSPDGERLAISIQDQQRDIWVYEWRRGILSRLTTHPALDADPVWTPDGKRIAFRSTRDGIDNIYWQRSDGSDVVQRLTDSKAGQWPMSWHPSGRLLAYREIGRDTRQDIWVLPLEGDDVSGWKPGKPTVLLGGPANESDAVFSPDGRWLAFQSDESGHNEVYVRSFPTAGPRTQVSVAGGLAPRWSSRNAKLFYRTEDGRIMTATYTVAGDSFRADPPSIWSDGPVSAFDVHPDGQRVAVLKGTSSQSAQSGKVVLIVNFFEELRRISDASR